MSSYLNLPRTDSFANINNKISESISQQQQQYSSTMVKEPTGYNEYIRPASSYSYNTSDYDSSGYQHPLIDLPISPTDSNHYPPYNNRQRIGSPPIKKTNYEVDTRNSYIIDEPLVKNSSISITSSLNSQHSLIFPPTQEMKQKMHHLLLQTEKSFKVIYAGDVEYKPERGILNKTKKGHFVLTNNHLLLYKNAQKARSEINIFDHSVIGTTPLTSDKERIFLKLSNIYAIQAIVTIPNTFRIEYLNNSQEALYYTFTVDSYKECGQWIKALRNTVKIHHLRISTISSTERSNVINRLTKQSDLFINSDQMNMYKVVFKEKRYKTGSDLPKEIFLPMIFVIGKFSIYFLPASVIVDDEYLKIIERDRFGLLAIQSIKYEDIDDTIILEVKQVDKANRQLVFASSFCEQIIQHLQRGVDSILPCSSSLFTSHVPNKIKSTQIISFKIPIDPEDEITGREDEEMNQFNTILRAYTAAMNLNKSRFNYSIYGPLKSKVFTLLSPNEVGGSPCSYQKFELLAIFKTLQANNIFVEVCFANCSLACLETWKIQKNQGWTEGDALKTENILSNEIYNLLTQLKSLRKLDFSNCSIGNISPDNPLRRNTALSTIGTIMSLGKTNLSRIHIGNNKMSESDTSKLIKGIKEHKKSIKELYLNDCNLEKDMVENVVKALFDKNPDQLIRLDLSCSHGMTIDSDLEQKMIHSFKRLEVLRMRGYNLLNMDYNFKLESSHLKELDIGGSKISTDSVHRLCQWIQSPSFQTIEVLQLGNCNLNGVHVSHILQSISLSGNRAIHLNLEKNPIMKEIMHLPKLHSAILQSEGPRSLSLAYIEWDDSTLREFIDCLRDNQIISQLNLSDISMKDTHEISEDTVYMLTSLFERNKVIRELELNMKHSQIPRSPFEKARPKSLICKAITQSLVGLRHNTTLQHLDLSGLGFEDEGALALARVLKTNRALRSICIDENNISIEGYLHLTKAIEENSTQITQIPIPRKDVRFQIRYLTFHIEDLIISENESQFFLIHTTSSDKKKAKKHELEMIIQERRTSELALKNLEGVIQALLIAVRKNCRELEEQYYCNLELQLQAQNAAEELAMAQIRFQQARLPMLPRTRNTSSGNVSKASSTTSSVYNSGSMSRKESSLFQQQQYSNRRSILHVDYSGNSLSSPVPSLHHNNSFYQNKGDPRMYLTHSNDPNENMILGKPHSYDVSSENQISQSPIIPNMDYRDLYGQHASELLFYQNEPALIPVDDPGFINDFGYADDYEQEFTDADNYIIQPQHHFQPRSAPKELNLNLTLAVQKIYLPPDARD